MSNRHLIKTLSVVALLFILIESFSCCISAINGNEQVKDENDIFITESESQAYAAWINPAYEGTENAQDIIAEIKQSENGFAVTENENESYIETKPLTLFTIDESEYTDWDSAVILAREKIKDFETGFSVKFRISGDDYKDFNFSDIYADMRGEIYEHTGNPDEGDYLLMNCQSLGVSIHLTVRDEKDYYIEFVFARMTYFLTEEQHKELDSLENQLLNTLNLSGETTYNKIKGVYDWMCLNITYSTDEERYDQSNLIKFTAYSALKKRSAVCQGYSTLFYRLMLKLGIDVRIVASSGHAWNNVCIDGLYYAADTTWDANSVSGEYRCFLRGELSITQLTSHERREEYRTPEYLEKYPISLNDFGKTPAEVNFKCGKNATWEIVGSELRIHGSGNMDDFTYMTLPWLSYISEIKTITVDEGITSIGEYAFAFMNKVESISLPSGVTKIGNNAFKNNTSIADVTLPDTVCSIGDYAFYGCSSLKKINFPSGLKKIGAYAFYRNRELNSDVTLSAITSIGAYAFYGCGSIKSIAFSEKLKEIPAFAFAYCGSVANEKIVLYVTGVGDSAFTDCKIKSVEFASNCNTIGDNAFEGCSALEEIVFRGDMPLFGSNSLKNVTADVCYPDDNATWSISALENVGGTIEWKNVKTEPVIVPDEDETIKYGDINGDGKIKGNDATLLLKYLAEWDVTISDENADCNGDGRIKGNDATLLLKYLAEWNVTLGK